MLGQILGEFNQASQKALSFAHMPGLRFDECLCPLQQGVHRVFVHAATILEAHAFVQAGKQGNIMTTNHIHGERLSQRTEKMADICADDEGGNE